MKIFAVKSTRMLLFISRMEFEDGVAEKLKEVETEDLARRCDVQLRLGWMLERITDLTWIGYWSKYVPVTDLLRGTQLERFLHHFIYCLLSPFLFQ